MAKFVSGDLRLKDDQKATFGTDLDCSMFWDGSDDQLRVTCTVSGVDPIEPYHLTTKWYVDTVFSGVDEHNELLNIQGGTTDQYYHMTQAQHGLLTDVSGVLDASSQHIHDDRYFTESEITTISGDIVSQIITDHGALTGLNDDDHLQYVPRTGVRGFTGTVSGVDPTQSYHLTTKWYVDQAVQQSLYGLDWQNSVISQNVAFGDAVASGTNRYIAPTTSGDWIAEYIYEWTGTSWSGIEPNEGFATWVEDEDIVYFYDDAYPTGDWIKISSMTPHNDLSGLQGGTTNEYYHLTSDQYTSVTNNGGVEDASDQHTHDDRYYTETEVDTISGSLQIQIDNKDNYQYWTFSIDGTSYDNITSTDTLDFVAGAGMSITRTGDDEITFVATSSGIDHGGLSGLGDDDHLQYVRADGGVGDSRGFTSTVSGVYPTQSYHLTTKQYVDDVTASGGVDRHGRLAISNGSSQLTVTFADLGHVNYTVNATMENDNDSPASIYAFIITGRTSNSFTVDFSGEMDSANYYLNWMVIEDAV